MSYRLSQLAPGSYDVEFNSVIIAALVRADRGFQELWTAELLVDSLPADRPHPFTELDHTFVTFNAVCGWLGVDPNGIEFTDRNPPGVCPEKGR